MKLKLFIAAGSLVAILGGCSKDNASSDPSGLSVRMTDLPGPYDSVLVDIRDVEITGSNGSFATLQLNAGIYNLLDFTNGVDTLLISGSLPGGTKIQQVRLILGPDNSVVVGGVNHPLATPSAEQSGLKLQVHETLTPGMDYMLLLDFDAEESIVDEGNGSYHLKPVIKLVSVTPL